MPPPVAQLRQVDGDARQYLFLWCPGCDDLVNLWVSGTNAWEWDGNLEAPTISPSILVTGGSNDRRCHSYFKAGVWEFLTDSTHPLAGHSVPMVPLPDWLLTEASC